MPKPNGQAEGLDPSRFAVKSAAVNETPAPSFSSSPEFNITIVNTTTGESPYDSSLIVPEKLYAVRKGISEINPSEELILVGIRQACGEALHYLTQALDEEDIVARETILTLFNDSAFRLGHHLTFNPIFGRAVALVHTAVIQNLGSIYSEKEILGLRRCLTLMRDNIYMSEAVLKECTSIVSREAGFDLSAATADGEFYDEDTRS
ncbi:MAG: hypothetical protein ACHQ1H_04930 [Nitrososphaerales archaeon]